MITKTMECDNKRCKSVVTLEPTMIGGSGTRGWIAVLEEKDFQDEPKNFCGRACLIEFYSEEK